MYIYGKRLLIPRKICLPLTCHRGTGINALHWIGAPHQSETKTENKTNKIQKRGREWGNTNRFGIIASEQPPQQNLFRKKTTSGKEVLWQTQPFSPAGGAVFDSVKPETTRWGQKIRIGTLHTFFSGNFSSASWTWEESKKKKGGWGTNLCAHTDTHVRDNGSDQCETTTKMAVSSQIQDRRRQWHPTPVLLPGKSHGRRSLVGCSP